MKSRNYLLALLSLTLTGMPALAVDYVACREMLRTKNELYAISKQYDNREIEIDDWWKSNYDKLLQECKEKLPKITKYEKVFDITVEENDCLSAEWYKKYDDIKKKRFNSGGGIMWYKKALKVEADMKRANCPY